MVLGSTIRNHSFFESFFTKHSAYIRFRQSVKLHLNRLLLWWKYDFTVAGETEGEVLVGDSSDSFEEYMTRDRVSSTRYLKRDTYRTSTDYIFERDLRTESYSDGPPPWLTEEEKINKYRMCRHSCHLLVQKLRPILCLRTKKEDDTCLPSTYGVSFLFG